MKTHVFRLQENSKLRESLDNFVKEKKIAAGLILGVVGGLTNVDLRMAGATKNKQDIRHLKGDYEIVSLVGTLSPNGSQNP